LTTFAYSPLTTHQIIPSAPRDVSILEIPEIFAEWKAGIMRAEIWHVHQVSHSRRVFCYNCFVIRPMISEGPIMAITVEAVYENGVLKPAQPLPLKEHEKVRVTVEQQQPSLAERIVARARALPQETLDLFPVDGASQHDHYIYGTPKRPE
jgi:predicted DNA-binding antitoxin AbrB/MazE fold protein